MNVLASFLESPDRPPETLRYHELQGFLFAVASAPELVPPSEWLPVVFGQREAGYASIEEAQAIMGEIIALYNAINSSVIAARPGLPPDCKFRRKTLANLEESAPVSSWSRGFLRGHQWLQEDWDACLPDDDHDFGVLLLALSFFASRKLATAFIEELGRTDLEEVAKKIRRVPPDAVAEYARIGRSIQQVLSKHGGPAESATALKVGRNDSCPCGSGRKYKKCCGARA